MQIDLANIDRMTLPELDTARRVLDVSKRALCERCELSETTYSRWMRHIRGQPGGTTPSRRSLKAVRDVLKLVAAERAAPSAGALERQRAA